MNSIKGKQFDLLAFFDVLNPHIVAIQETKIDSSVATSELCPYKIFRKDRNRHGGGVMLLMISIRTFRTCPCRNWKTTRNRVGLKYLQAKLHITWQVGTVHLMAQEKASNFFVIRSGINIKAINSPQFMFYGVLTSRTLFGQTDLTSHVQC